MDKREAQAIVSNADSSHADVFSVLRDRDVPLETRQKALMDPRLSDADIVRWASQNPDNASALVPFCGRVAALRWWATSHSREIRQCVAFNPVTPSDVVAALARDRDPSVRSNSVWNGNLPEHIVKDMSDHDAHDGVRAAANDALRTEFGQALRSSASGD